MVLDARPSPKPGLPMSQRSGESEPQKVGSLLSKWQTYNDESKKEDSEPAAKAPPPDAPQEKNPNSQAPSDMEIMEALLDAFEDDTNLGDSKKSYNWLKRNGYEKVGEWLDKLNKHDYYRAMSSFFENLAKFRQRQPGMLSGMQEAEEAPSADIRLDDPSVPPAEPDEEPSEPEEKPTEKPSFDINSAVMDMYLEGIDITRRSQLIDSLEKNGYDVEVETINGMALPDFYSFLSDFFKQLASALQGGEDAALPPVEPEPVATPEEPVAVEPAEEPTPAAEEEAVPGEEIPVEEPAAEPNALEVELKGLGASGPLTLADIASLALKYYTITTVEDRAKAEAEIAEKAKVLGVEMDPQASAAFSAGMSYMEKKTLSPGAKWDQMTPELRSISLQDGGIDQVAADEYSKYDWDDPSLSYAAKEAFEEALALADPVEMESANMPQIRRKAMRQQVRITAPEELLPGEISEAERMAKACVEGGIPLDEAVKRVTKKMSDKAKGYPTPIKMKLESYLTGLLGGLVEDGVPAAPAVPVAAAGQPAPVATKPEEPKKDDEDEDEEEDEDGKKDAPKGKDDKPVITGKKGGEDEAKKDEEEEEGEEEEGKKDGEEEEGKKDEGEEEEGKKDGEEEEGKKDDEEEEEDDEDDEEEEGKKKDAVAAPAAPSAVPSLPVAAPIATPMGEDKADSKVMRELLRLSLSPSSKQFGARTTAPRVMPKAIQLSESTASAGVTGARDTGVLDVFSYGGYLERALPYLISASMSRMEDQDKEKFVNIYRKFTETNDIVEMTKLSGGMADVIEWADATQEGAELVKNLRFMSDFLNVLRGSVDFTKKAFPVV